ncbi:Adenylate cyclase related protein [Leptospira biflexa serovar Patoc strain 'Patoc 1 (Ames)']|uniref:Putative adenylate/guanylate cyclase, family 3 putative signal peptide n=1 Tax=Leptospira biflexa serovar Patoc (strain Patoc 1 / ATCC 23582 / Paris) TaxID=456481 RepID=B0SJC1_LEPBP|nr:adenylate/guanylate cyclase domain-containing protein [Leptospira biflexa]ABZ93065.1 Adenylate cyclase related protein [Leptospira biflexa serovar Patoc strain 'Patoc 1 (Ames)']ABZ96684.1 Putative adenylate/guanylate cyclase, family 3; putative signal peptide [Leptospira biflexa serovar Patoc strain 'Patoc 1 (Paris)']
MKTILFKLKNFLSRNREVTSDFQFPIRYKLLLITSIVLLFSMSGVIFLASYFFRKDSEVRVKENNIKINEILSLKVKSDLHSIRQDVHITASAIFRNNQSANQIAKELFEEDQNFVFIGAYDSGFNAKFEAVNEDFLQKYDYQKSEVKSILKNIQPKLKKSFSGTTVIWNISPHFRNPILCISFPLSETKDTHTILVTLVKLDTLLDAFQTSGPVETFLVSEDGSVLAHPDAKVVLSGINLNDLAIVDRMKKSTVDNGQFRYENKDGEFYLAAFKKLGFGGVGVISQVREVKIFEEVNNIQKRNVYLLIISLSLSFIVVYIFAKSLSTPILKLVDASEEIRRGNFHINLHATTHDEIGTLTKSFVSMGRGLEEREKLKDSFGKFVNQEIAELAAKGKLSIGGKRKYCTIFFSDIRSFTAISEKLQPEEVVEFLNLYMTEMVKCVQETGGTVDKFIGDAIMATWGALRDHKEHAKASVETALSMREKLIEFNKTRGTVKKPIIKIGCGINTGYVIAGQIGSSDKMEYTVIGDSVNLASRVESFNKETHTDILITETTYQEVKSEFHVVSMGEIEFKGKSKAQKVYAVLGKKSDPNAPKNLSELQKLVGIEIAAKKAKR